MNNIGIIVITKKKFLVNSIFSALSDLKGEAIVEVKVKSEFQTKRTASIQVSEYRKLQHNALRFLAQCKGYSTLHVFQFSNLEEAIQETTEYGSCLVSMIIFDLASSQTYDCYPMDIKRSLDSLYQELNSCLITTLRTPYSDVVYNNKLPIWDGVVFSPEYIERIFPDEPWILQADVLCLFMNLFQELFTSQRRQRLYRKRPPRITLGDELARFLTSQVGSNWQFSYYTGSVVSSLIEHLERILPELGVIGHRGPSEHSLACGALANWQLYQRHFLIVVTSGMMDEFKGTLVNLRESQARGFIVCAENRLDQWFAFQGTITNDEDMRQVLAAKGISTVYLQDLETLAEDLEQAFNLYNSRPGPVVLLVTQQVLEATTPLTENIQILPTEVNSLSVADVSFSNKLDEVIQIINHEPSRLLWQVGRLSSEEETLVLSIAEDAGIALVDSLTHPGTVSKYMGGRLIHNYLGTLGVYGYTPSVYSFLHTDGEINSKESQCLFFLKSKLGQVATPFSRIVLKNRLRLVQITNKSEHFAPFVDYPLEMSLLDFLRHLKSKLSVDPAIFSLRKKAIEQASNTEFELSCQVPTIPMNPNYFTFNLNQLIEELIQQEGYQYTGLYDVGRCGISAIRNITRTNPGFSGWYGRALMGDALLATLAVAPAAQNSILAFIGDGAKSLVPNILPFLVEAATNMPEKFQKNITIFYFLNGGHSMINTYQSFLARESGRQMRIVNMVEPEWQKTFGSLSFCHFQLQKFDRNLIRTSLLEPNRLNLFSVFVNHNNHGDGLSLLASTSWEFGT